MWVIDKGKQGSCQNKPKKGKVEYRHALIVMILIRIIIFRFSISAILQINPISGGFLVPIVQGIQYFLHFFFQFIGWQRIVVE